MNKISGTLALAFGVSLLTAGFSADAAVNDYTVFKTSGTNYRIPAISYNRQNNVLIAFTDNRGSSTADLSSSSNIKVNYRVSTDGGKTWGDIQTLTDKISNYGDPAVVYNPTTGKYIIMVAQGNSWSKYVAGKIYTIQAEYRDGKLAVDNNPVDVTGDFAPNGKAFVSSGSLLYTPDGDKGTLWAVSCANESSTAAGAAITNFLVKTTNDGEAWGKAASTGLTGGDESKVVALDDNKKIISRRNAKRNFWITDLNAQGGITGFTQTPSTIDEGNCNGGFLRFQTSGTDATDYLIQSVCTNRSNQTGNVYYSTDKGNNWTIGNVTFTGEYSDLVHLGGNTLGILYETKVNNVYETHFKTFTITDLVGKVTTLGDLPGALKCDGKGYLRTAANNALNVAADGEITVTARILITDMNNLGTNPGILATRTFKRFNAGLLASDLTAKRHISPNIKGFEMYGGNIKNPYGNNVSLDNALSGNDGDYPVLGNKQYKDFSQNTGEWVHVAFVYNSKKGYCHSYINGVKFEEQGTYSQYATTRNEVNNVSEGNGSQTMTGKLLSSPMGLLIGARWTYETNYEWFDGLYCTPVVNTDQIWSGAIDDVRIYNCALSSEEIQKDFEWGFPLRKGDGMRAAYDFSQLSGSTYADITGHNVAATANTISGYAFPASEAVTLHNIDPEGMGTLTVTAYKDGAEATIANGEEINTFRNTDFRVQAKANDGYELVGIFVNGNEISYTDFSNSVYALPDGAKGGFFKSNLDNNVVEAKFRPIESETHFYLVGDFCNNELNSDYKFQPTTQKGIYELEINTETLSATGTLDGEFHVQEGPAAEELQARSAKAATSVAPIYLNLYAHESELVEGQEAQTVRPVEKKAHRLVHVSTGTRHSFQADNSGYVDGSALLKDPQFQLDVTDPGHKTLTLVGGTVTGIESVDADASTIDAIYNLQGIKVETPEKGKLYIVVRNGHAFKQLWK